MIFIAVILGLIALFGGFYWLVTKLKSEYDEGSLAGAVLFQVFGVAWFFVFLFTMRINFGTNNLTGYIYSSDTKFGYITGHIRFSEQAGMDVQPSFCVKADSEAGRQIKKLAGSGKKVIITEPPYFYFTNNPFACGTTKMTIVESTQ